jgi:hypothetical protein
LVKTDAKIKIISGRTKKVIAELTPKDFNSFKKKSGHIFNFEDFDDPDILRQGKLIHSIFSKLRYYYRKGIPVSIVTARSSSNIVREFFLENGIDIHPALVIAINDPGSNLQGNIAERKQKAIKSLIDDGYINLIFFDDNEDNLALAKNLEGYKNSRIKLIRVI